MLKNATYAVRAIGNSRMNDKNLYSFECGHVVSEKNGGKPTIDNLRPICSFCNKSVGTMNMEEFKKKYNIP